MARRLYRWIQFRVTHRPSMRLAWGVPLCGAILCLLGWLFAGIYLYWDNAKLVNFLAAWIPFALTVLIAFLPDARMRPVKKFLWRSVVILVGFAWSVVLWHQQVVTEGEAARSQQQIVRDANQHSDEKFKEVETDLRSTKSDLGQRIDNLPSEISKTESHVESDIRKSIEGIAFPPEKHPEIKFSLLPSINIDSPTLTESVPVDKDGAISVDFMAMNVSEVGASSLDLWVRICDGCSFVKEPTGFENAGDKDSTVRHRAFGDLNPGVSANKMTVQFKLPVGAPRTCKIGFQYSCKNCGKLGAMQVATITPQYPAGQ